MIRWVLIAVAATVVALGVAPAFAQTACGDRVKFTTQLEKNYNERRSGLGLTSNGGVIELFTAESGSWTILITMPGSVTCVFGSGEDWEHQRKLPALSGEVS